MSVSVKHWLRRRFRAFVREPSWCLNCGALSFTYWQASGTDDRWVCDECGWTHAPTFGGCWRADPPEDGEDGAILSC